MRKFSFLVVPRTGGKIKEFGISPVTLVLFCVLVIFGFASIYLTIKGINPFQVEKNELANIRAENRNLEAQLEEMTSKMILLREKIGKLMKKEEEIGMLADMTGEATQGGPSQPLQNDGKKLDNITEIQSNYEKLRGLSLFYDSLFKRLSQNIALVDRIPTIRPVMEKAFVSVKFGLRKDPFSGDIKPHQGVDFASTIGTPVLSAAAGTVIFAGKEKGFGNVIRIDHGSGYLTMYSHLDNITAYKGQTVKKGQKIGTLGNSGRSIGPHLHYEVLKNGKNVDPELYF